MHAKLVLFVNIDTKFGFTEIGGESTSEFRLAVSSLLSFDKTFTCLVNAADIKN